MSCGSAISPTISLTGPAIAFARPDSPSIAWRASPRAMLTMLTTLTGFGTRRAQRRALGELDDRLLADIGVSRRDAIAETRKPFWR